MVLEQNPKQRSAKNTSSSFEFSSMKRTLIPYLDSLMLLIMTISIIVTRYCPFLQGRYAHMVQSGYLGAMVAMQTLQRLLGLYNSFEAPTFEFKKKNLHRIGKIFCFLIAAASSFYGLTTLGTVYSLGNLLKSVSMTVFPYMVYDSLTGTKQFDQTSNLMSALLLISGLVLEKFGYKVTGVAAVLSMLIKSVYGMLGSKNVSKPNLFNALLAVVSVVCLAVAVKYKVVFNLPNLADLFSTASTSATQ